jgi:hypothetical protein
MKLHKRLLNEAAERAGYEVLWQYSQRGRLVRGDESVPVFFYEHGGFSGASIDGKSFSPSARNHSRRIGAREALDNFLRYLESDPDGRRRFRWMERGEGALSSHAGDEA